MLTSRNEGMEGGRGSSVLAVAMVLLWILEPTCPLPETLRSQK